MTRTAFTLSGPATDGHPPIPGAARPRPESWLERWRGVTADLARLQYPHPLVDAVDESDGRMIRAGDRWLADFASSNYLGFDLDAEIIEAVPDYLRRWGSRTGFSRTPSLRRQYAEIEDRLTELLRCEDTFVVPAGGEIHAMIIPVLAAGGTIFLDRRAQKSIVDGCALARAHGATILTFNHDNPDELGELLAHHPARTRLICLDGVNSLTGATANLGSIAMLARAHDAMLYLDDEAGFGVIGERGADELCAYGKRGNAIVRHFGESYDNVVLVSGFAKAYSSLLTFLAIPRGLKASLRSAVPINLHPTPAALAAVATVLEGLAVNERRGDALRLELHRMTARVLEALADIGVPSPNRTGYPIVELRLTCPAEIDSAGRFLLEHGIYPALATPPVVPAEEVGIRLHLTSANTARQVTHLIEVLEAVADRFGIVGQDPAAAVQRGLAQLVAP